MRARVYKRERERERERERDSTNMWSDDYFDVLIICSAWFSCMPFADAVDLCQY